MQPGCTARQQAITKVRYHIQPQRPDRMHVIAIAREFQPQPAWNLGSAQIGKTCQLAEVVDRHDARHDRYAHSASFCLVHETEIGIGIEEILSDRRVGSCLDLACKSIQIGLRTTGLRVVLRIGRHLDMEMIAVGIADKRNQLVGIAELADFAHAGAQACAVEASSIGIEEGRLDGTRVDVAVLTNLTRDHLDYHGSMESYAEAKKRLFAWPRLRLAVVNLDDPFGVELAEMTTAAKVVGYTQGDDFADRQGVVRAEDVEEAVTGLRFRLSAPSGRARVETALVGRYNVSNLLAVAAVLLDAGLKPAEVAARFAELTPPPGRLEKIGGYNEPLIVVDYAHTPDALESALAALRGVATARGGKLVAVFGCGGDRDRGKRPLMGEIATRLADRVVLTSDNPRSEDPLAILAEIRQAAGSAEVIADRAAAIRATIGQAHPADVILLAGKGHEPYQEIAGVRRPFSDLTEAQGALVARQEEGA